MATPVIIGVGAIAAAIAGRSLIRRGLIGGKGAAEEWVKGGFKAKMDRKEAIAILGLKFVIRSESSQMRSLNAFTGIIPHYACG